jgi:hypothetical protein
MSYVGYSGVADLALTYPALAEGTAAITSIGGDVGQGVAGATVIWLGAGTYEPGYILLEISGTSDPLDYVLEENTNKIELEAY